MAKSKQKHLDSISFPFQFNSNFNANSNHLIKGHPSLPSHCSRANVPSYPQKCPNRPQSISLDPFMSTSVRTLCATARPNSNWPSRSLARLTPSLNLLHLTSATRLSPQNLSLVHRSLLFLKSQTREMWCVGPKKKCFIPFRRLPVASLSLSLPLSSCVSSLFHGTGPCFVQ